MPGVTFGNYVISGQEITMYIITSGIIFIYDVDKMQNMILKKS